VCSIDNTFPETGFRNFQIFLHLRPRSYMTLTHQCLVVNFPSAWWLCHNVIVKYLSQWMTNIILYYKFIPGSKYLIFLKSINERITATPLFRITSRKCSQVRHFRSMPWIVNSYKSLINNKRVSFIMLTLLDDLENKLECVCN